MNGKKVSVVSRDDNNFPILALGSKKWKEGEPPTPPLKCWLETEVNGKPAYKEITHTAATWRKGSTILVSGFVRVVYNSFGAQWIVKLVPAQVSCSKIVVAAEEGCAFGATAECDIEEPYESPAAGSSVADAEDY